MSLNCPTYSPFFGFAGASCAMFLSCIHPYNMMNNACIKLYLAIGAAYGTVKSGIAIANVSVIKPSIIVKAMIPVIMSSLLSIYGLIIAITTSITIKPGRYALYSGALHLAGGLCVGFSSLSAGLAIGAVGDIGVRGLVKQSKLFVGLVLILIFSEILALYGLIIAIFLGAKATGVPC